jgi:hypothetical protein
MRMKKVFGIISTILLYPVFIVASYYIVLFSYYALSFFIGWCVSLGLLGIILLLLIAGGILTLYSALLTMGVMVAALKLNKIFIVVLLLIFNCFFAFRGLKIIWTGEAEPILLLISSVPEISLFLAILISSLNGINADRD